MTEVEIKDQIQRGNPIVMKWIYQHYYVGLCSYANKYIKNKDNSEEIVQQTLFKFWEKRESIQVNDTIIGYLFSMVKNNCLNHIKHQQIVNRYNENYLKNLQDTEELLSISQENGLSIYLAHELEIKIMIAIENLPEQCREIFKMSRFDGLKHQEIAEKKEVTINTVQKQISIALEKIKTALDSYLLILISFIIRMLY